MFLTYVFGRVCERSQGLLGLWATYLAAAIGTSWMHGRMDSGHRAHVMTARRYGF